MDWREQANCRGTDTEMFFAGADGTSDPLGVRAWACGPCPVRGECLTDALMREARNPGGRHGIYGGMTPAERALLGGRQTELIPDPRTTTEVPF